ncbi:MAG: hypothetical protein JWO20_1200 [Candidatus Angelobacter sp.]|jgi:hypothetical protein|nr:hypothetical protein [Candidatus Angelobacter sp.]
MNGPIAIDESGTCNRQCYTAPLAQMSAPFRSRIIFLFIVSFSFSFAAAQDAQSPTPPYTKAATEFVADLMSRAGSPSLIAVAFENKSEVTPAELAQIRRAIEAQFRAANVRIVKPERALAEFNITISESAQGLLWVAEIKQGLSTHIVMLPVQRASSAVAVRPATFSLRRTSVFVQTDHQIILDFRIIDTQTFLVLTPEQLTTYWLESGKWRAHNSSPIKHSQPWPRDVRGRLFLRETQLQVILPGVRCAGILDGNRDLKSLDCADSDDPWTISFDSEAPVNAFYAPNKNNFTGLLSSSGSDETVPAFYSAASIGDMNPAWIFAGTDGRARYYPNMKQQPVILSGLGSDLASIKSECGNKWQVLVTRPGDRTKTDAVQALEIVNREATPVSTPVEFSGPIISLWGTAERGSVNAISKDLMSGNYEASTLSITCNQ